MFDVENMADARVLSLSMFLSGIERHRGASLSRSTIARQDREARKAARVYQQERAKRGLTVVRRRVAVS